MTAKEYLNQIRVLKIKISQLEKELNELRLDIMTGSGIDYSKEKIQTSKNNDQMLVYMAKVDDIESRIIHIKASLLIKKHDIISMIQSLDNALYIQILYKHYVEDKPLKVVASEIGYEYKWTCKLHGYALLSFADIHSDTLNNTTKHDSL